MSQFSTIYKVDFIQPALPTFAFISLIAQNAFHSSTMVGENFEIYSSQMAKNALKMCDLQTVKSVKNDKFSNICKKTLKNWCTWQPATCERGEGVRFRTKYLPLGATVQTAPNFTLLWAYAYTFLSAVGNYFFWNHYIG